MTADARRWTGFAIKGAVTAALIWLVLRNVDLDATLERMETSVHADVAGTVKEIAAAPGTRVEPHDLVVILEV